MAQTSANLVERVLPANVPLRQWVVTFPFELRGRLGFDAKLLSAVNGIVIDTILGFYERRMRGALGPLTRIAVEPKVPGPKAQGADVKTRLPKLQSGAVTAVQRTNSDFKLNPHLHAVVLDGVFVEQPDGSPPRFEPLPHLKSIEVAEAVTSIRCRVIELARR
jgi:hypothetical protein